MAAIFACECKLDLEEIADFLETVSAEHSTGDSPPKGTQDLMFADMDQNLREMGLGDLAVGKRVKGMAAATRSVLSTL